MAPLNSFALWGVLGLIGVAVPIIIHLLYRKNRKQTDWAAMELLRKALVVRSGQIKLEDFLVLLLRCLAMLLIAFALLRPVLKGGASAWLGEKRVGIVVAIDASLSMGHGEHSRFEKALTRAGQVLKTARRGDPVTVVMLSEHPKVLVRAADFDPAAVAARLEDQTSPSPHRLGLEGNLALLAELADELKAGATEVYLITDGQQSDWGALTSKGRDSLENLASDSRFFILPVAADGEENLSITDLRYASGPLQRSGVARFEAEVRNLGRRTADTGNIEFFVDGKLISRRALGQIKPGAPPLSVPFYVNFDQPGELQLQASISKDELVEDNSRSAAVTIRGNVRALCVGDDRGAGAGGIYFAVRALRLKKPGEAGGAMEVNHVPVSDLGREQFDDYDLILLAGVPEPPPDVIARLRRFTERGGGLVVFAGDEVDPERYARAFGTGDAGLLPGSFGKTLAAPEEGKAWSVAVPDSDHPLSAIIKRLRDDVVSSASVSRVLEIEPAPGAQTLLTIAENGTPLLVSREVGDGSVLLFSTSADMTWNELALSPLYTMLLQQAAVTLTSRPGDRVVDAGETAQLKILGEGAQRRLKLTRPDGESETVFLSRVGEVRHAEVSTDAAGLYQLTDDGGRVVAAVAANPPAGESDVRIIDASALDSQLGDAGIWVIEPSLEPAASIKKVRRGSELSRLLLILGILCFLAQSVLAKIFTNRMSRGETDVEASLQLSQVAAARRT